MCVVSMVQDAYTDRWRDRQFGEWPYNNQPNYPWAPNNFPYYPIETPEEIAQREKDIKEQYEKMQELLKKRFPAVDPLTDDEIKEFREMIKRAKEYDRKNNEPECPSEEKTAKMVEALKNLGVSQEKIDEIIAIVKG